MIRCDDGPEYISETTKTWAATKHGIEIAVIQSGQPLHNDYVERDNRTVMGITR